MNTYRVLMCTDAPCGTSFRFAIQVEADYFWQAYYLAGNEFQDSEIIGVSVL